jgi:hypothetical protein
MGLVRGVVMGSVMVISEMGVSPPGMDNWAAVVVWPSSVSWVSAHDDAL